MSIGYRGKTTNAGRENVAAQAQSERETMWGEITGTIVSFDPATQTASIQPNYKPRHNGEPVDMPQLDEVPVRFTRAGGFMITSPVRVGDQVALRPQMRSSEEYHTGGDYTPVSDTRTFSLSDMEAFLDGGEALTNPITNFNSSNMEIRTADGSFKIEMSEDGKFRIIGSDGNWFDMLAALVELCRDGLNLLGTEVTLTHAGEYADIGAQIGELASKLRSMAL